MNLENRVGLKRLLGFDVGISNGVQCRNVSVAGDESHHAGNHPVIDKRFHALRNASESRRVEPRFRAILNDSKRRGKRGGSQPASNKRIGTLRLFYPAAYTLEHMLRVCVCLAAIAGLVGRPGA